MRDRGCEGEEGGEEEEEVVEEMHDDDEDGWSADSFWGYGLDSEKFVQVNYWAWREAAVGLKGADSTAGELT